MLQDASLVSSFFEQDASFLLQAASEPADATLAAATFLLHEPAPHFFSAGAAARAAELATTAAAKAAMDFKFMVISFGVEHAHSVHMDSVGLSPRFLTKFLKIFFDRCIQSSIRTVLPAGGKQTSRIFNL